MEMQSSGDRVEQSCSLEWELEAATAAVVVFPVAPSFAWYPLPCLLMTPSVDNKFGQNRLMQGVMQVTAVPSTRLSKAFFTSFSASRSFLAQFLGVTPTALFDRLE